MNRPIKFRAWDTKREILRQVDEIDFYAGHVALDGDENITPISDIMLMQFTGLTDKNGKEIYDGDVLKSEEYHYGHGTPETHIYPVVWEENRWDGVHVSIDGSNLEVIGNIYDNPELLNNPL